MNQTELAKRINITQQYISRIMNGTRRPSWEKAKLLAKITGTNPELWLEGGANDRKLAFQHWCDLQKS
ncbi:MAG: helix-turn-helix domain-containing protein [Desulfarculales bacterium]|jgi:transcriptional regulator with XRE-family HTH domain|nr:helix-turn-helix domain-containing protein [Desulfarculales bacterium]